MENIKLGNLYLSKKESANILEFLAKMRNINDYKSKSSDRLYEIFKKQSKNKERIDNIREDLKDLSYKLSKSHEKYHDYDDYEYKGIKDIKDLFKLPIDKDYYKPVLVKSGYNNNLVQYKSKGDKTLSI